MEILFRGFKPFEGWEEWSVTICVKVEKVKGYWVYGSYISDGNDSYILTKEDMSNGIDIDGWFQGMMHCVIPETIGQYTNLHDSAGNVIFDGDILEQGNTKWLVVFESQAFCVKQIGCGYTTYLNEIIDKQDDIKVIGNKWSNPEFLEG